MSPAGQARAHQPPEEIIDRLRRVLDPVDRFVGLTGARRSDYDLNGGRPAISIRHALRPAAVLAPLIEREGEWRVVLTRRAETLARHAGQIAFPGGRIDADDASPLAAALREAHEEIGLDPHAVDVLGAFDPYETVTGFCVTPFVGVVRAPFDPQPDPREVAEVFETSFETVVDPERIQTASAEFRGVMRTFLEINVDNRVIWGATAGMLKALSDRLSAPRPQVAGG